MFPTEKTVRFRSGARAAAIACVMSFLPSGPAVHAQTFSDVPPQYWAFPFIEQFAQRGITAGCGGGQFCPEDLVTRAQMAVFMIREMGRPKVTDGNGVGIGRFLNLTDSFGSVDVFTSTGYIVRVGLQTGEVPLAVPDYRLFFLEPDCVGPAYARMPSGFVYRLYKLDGSPALHYTPKTSAFIPGAAYASIGGGGCQNEIGNIPYGGLWEVMENDPAVTGVSTDTFPLPLHIDP